MRRLFAKLCPPRDEIVIYTMSVSLIVIFFADETFRDLLSSFTVKVLVEGPAKAFEMSWWEGFEALSSGVIVALICVASLVASLYLPFTRRKLDDLVSLVIIAHLTIICVSNSLVVEKQGDAIDVQFLISVLFALMSLFYILVFVVGLRFRLLTTVISDRQASGQKAMIAGVSVALLVVIFSLGFSLHWANCYAIAATYAIVLTKFFDVLSAQTEKWTFS